jgi:hypothetical protein
MGAIVYDLQELYRYQFGGRPFVIQGRNNDLSQLTGSSLVTIDQVTGKEVWLPVKFKGLDPLIFKTTEVLLPYAVIKISSSKTIVRTPMAERKGTVKEYFSAEDFQISLKGFVIDEQRVWPEKELLVLKKLDELSTAVQLDNALTNIFLDKDTRVVITKLDLPEVEGGRKHIRPFSMSLESDSIFTLNVPLGV